MQCPMISIPPAAPDSFPRSTSRRGTAGPARTLGRRGDAGGSRRSSPFDPKGDGHRGKEAVTTTTT